jgi:LEA14-like dessication related protein
MAKNQLLIGGGILSVILLFGRGLFLKGEAVRSLNVNVSGLDFNKKDRTFIVKLRLINPANADLKIKSIVGDVVWNGTYAATIDYRNEFTLKSNEERTLQLPIKMNLELFSIVADVIAKKFKSVLNGKFEIKANINAEGVVVPFEYEKEVKLV